MFSMLRTTSLEKSDIKKVDSEKDISTSSIIFTGIQKSVSINRTDFVC